MPDAAAGDDRHVDRVGDGAGELDVEAVAGAVAVHRREQDLAGAQLLALGRPPHGVEPGRVAPAVGEHLEAALGPPAGVDGHDDALRAELPRDLARSSSGSSTAAVLTATLSAPARSNRRASSTERTPPPTVNGMNTCSAVRRATSTIVSRASDDAVMSRNTTSSAPSAS